MTPVDVADHFSARLSLALNALNLSRSQLAALVGVNKSVVSRWLSGEMKPSGHNLARISAEVAKRLPGFNMNLWSASHAEFEAALGLSHSSGSSHAAATTSATPPRRSGQLPRVGRYGAMAVAVLLVVAVAGWVASNRREPPKQTPTRPVVAASVAVMPFVNMSGDPAKEYLGDGIAEELLNDLSNTPHLQVASRTSSFSFKGKGADIGEIAQKLHVRAVLEGSAHQEGRRIRIVAQLIDAKSGFHLWSASYDRDLGDILAVQDEIAGAIVAALTPRLTPEQVTDRARSSIPRRINPDAYTAYLQGRYAESRSNAEEFVRSIAFYRQAIKLQPDFADAHAAIAMTALGLFMNGERRDLFGTAKEAITTALRLDPQNFRARLADARAKELEWKWQAADLAIQTLLQKYPDNAELHFEYGIFLENLGLWEKSMAELRRAAELEPLSPSIRDNISAPLRYLNRDHEALAELRQVLKLNPDFIWAFSDLCGLYAKTGKLKEAREILRDRLTAQHADDRETIWCAWFIAQGAHDTRELKRRARQAESLYARSTLGASWVAYPYAMLNDDKQAMRWLEKAYADHDGNLSFALVDPDLPGHVRNTLRWQKLMQQPEFQELARVRTQILARGG